MGINVQKLAGFSEIVVGSRWIVIRRSACASINGAAVEWYIPTALRSMQSTLFIRSPLPNSKLGRETDRATKKVVIRLDVLPDVPDNTSIF